MRVTVSITEVYLGARDHGAPLSLGRVLWSLLPHRGPASLRDIETPLGCDFCSGGSNEMSFVSGSFSMSPLLIWGNKCLVLCDYCAYPKHLQYPVITVYCTANAF